MEDNVKRLHRNLKQALSQFGSVDLQVAAGRPYGSHDGAWIKVVLNDYSPSVGFEFTAPIEVLDPENNRAVVEAMIQQARQHTREHDATRVESHAHYLDIT